MELLPQQPNTQVEQAPPACTVCHQLLLPHYFFCPNCGTKVQDKPLSTTIPSQILLYAFSIILPPFCFLFIKNWTGVRYLRSTDQKTRTIGIVAFTLIILSTIVTGWYAYSLTQRIIKNSVTSINSQMDGY